MPLESPGCKRIGRTNGAILGLPAAPFPVDAGPPRAVGEPSDCLAPLLAVVVVELERISHDAILGLPEFRDEDGPPAVSPSLVYPPPCPPPAHPPARGRNRALESGDDPAVRKVRLGDPVGADLGFDSARP